MSGLLQGGMTGSERRYCKGEWEEVRGDIERRNERK